MILTQQMYGAVDGAVDGVVYGAVEGAVYDTVEGAVYDTAHLSPVTAAWREIDGKTNKACIAVYEARRLSKR